MIYLDDADVMRLASDPADMRAAIADGFRLYRAGGVVAEPKTSLDITGAHKFQSLCAAAETLSVAVNKWVGVAPPEAGAGVHSTLTVNDFATARPLAVMAGNALTGLRTAAMSAVAAEVLADRSRAHTLGFIGCGLQARHHLAAFRAVFPHITAIKAHSRGATRDAFAAWSAETHGLSVEPIADAREVVETSSLLVSTVPAGGAPFLAAEWVPAGAFVAAVDLGRAFAPEGLGAMDGLFTDDFAQEAAHPLYPGLRPFDADLAELATDGAAPAGPGDRRMFVFRGHGVGDLAAAALVCRRALETGTGRELSAGVGLPLPSGDH